MKKTAKSMVLHRQRIEPNKKQSKKGVDKEEWMDKNTPYHNDEKERWNAK